MDVDKTRRDIEATSIDFLPGWADVVTDRHNPTVANADVGAESRISRSIDQRSISDRQIKRSCHFPVLFLLS
ncbi:hypothetical protein J2W40_003333 [Sphingobium xenophagum]|uniref:Uncharacterized protein n=1 Tax=Sphingobium xenophagum TaxID=121428 RepID=A0ABU1X5B8_SPHXE|nr:hypothetical protein [Sphingobium xenophagum]MDR7156489.1 hypothetical protein [Sphingobium xenophagum]